MSVSKKKVEYYAVNGAIADARFESGRWVLGEPVQGAVVLEVKEVEL